MFLAGTLSGDYDEEVATVRRKEPRIGSCGVFTHKKRPGTLRTGALKKTWGEACPHRAAEGL
jgi:hypothetical protein